MARKQLVTNRPATGLRSTRYPVHNFWGKSRPHQLQPVAIAPVLAGDSLRHARFEARCITDPIKDPVTGWWAEYYLFYVPVSTFDEYAAVQTFFATDSESPSLASLDTTEEAWSFYENTGNGPNWLRMAMKPIVRHFFRREEEDWNTQLLDTVPIASIPTKSWVDAVRTAASVGTPSVDYAGRWAAYQLLRESNLTTLDFVDYLASQGVEVPQQLQESRNDKRKPELLRYVRQFAYPQNTVDPSTGGMANACSWVVSERCDKRIYAGEPGFLVLVSCFRPKLYRSNQNAAGVSLLRNGRLWHSMVQADAPQEVLVQRVGPTGSGPLAVTADYIIDSNALLSIGDEFRFGTGAPVAALPAAALTNTSYPSGAELDALYVSGTSNKITQEGAIHFAVSSRRSLETI